MESKKLPVGISDFKDMITGDYYYVDKTLFIKEIMESAVKSALEQIENQKYESELLQRGIKNYKKLAIVFKGKEVTVKES